MVHAEFFRKAGNFSGFRISGHAGYADSGEDIVCAAVSSAVQLMVNLLSEFDCDPEVSAADNVVDCRTTASADTASAMLEQLKLHFESVTEEFPETIKITVLEV